MSTVIRLISVLLCTMLLYSCADGVNEGVLIVPSSQNGSMVSEAVSMETADSVDMMSESDVISAETAEMAESLESVVEEAAVPDDMDDAIANARLLMEDAQFCALLAQYGAQISDGEPLASVAAVLAYQKLHSETAVPQFPDAADGDLVYWTVGGSVWHVTDACTALAKSKSILSGTESAAQQAGKTRVCKRCGA